jgi:arylsulfatase A-like enzyme
VCSPYRASLITGQYWLTHGIFHNDKPLGDSAVSIAQAYKSAGYDTAYIGKWHINGHIGAVPLQESRDAFIPRQRRQGFDYWKVRECAHDYHNSWYYGDTPEREYWGGYDAFAQTSDAQQYIRDHASRKPFMLFLSWGPPHDPYQTAPEEYRELYKYIAEIPLRPNVPEEFRVQAQETIAGYYAHIAALDAAFGKLLNTLEENRLDHNTIVVFTSDHGDMLYSHGQVAKQKPWDESVCVPFLVRFPQRFGPSGRSLDMPLNTPDIMPTLLGLSRLPVPSTVEGRDFSKVLTGEAEPSNDAALLMLPVPFHQWNYSRGGKEYRGIRTRRHTYVRDLSGPWLLYDNVVDPFQMNNICGRPEAADIQAELDAVLGRMLASRNDRFLPGPEYMRMWNYAWDGTDDPQNSRL